MKYLLVLLVVAVAVWCMLRVRGKQQPPAAPPPAPRRPDGRPGAAPMIVACAHCGLNLPDAEVVRDADGRAFCSDAHRLAGPR